VARISSGNIKKQKNHNKALAQLRIKIEHKIGELKVFKILVERYRNFQKKFHMRLNFSQTGEDET